MRILFDTNTPAPLARHLKAHQVTRAGQRGWHTLENGALLAAAEHAEFDVLVTCDQNLRYQQNFKGRKLSVVVLWTNRWPILQRAAARIATAVDFVQGGQIVFVDATALERRAKRGL